MGSTLSLARLQSLIEINGLKHFAQKPYGLELVMYLYEAQKAGKEVSIDEVYNSLVSPMPRREAFGIFLNQLEQASLIEKNTHSTKKSMKKIELSTDIFKALEVIK